MKSIIQLLKFPDCQLCNAIRFAILGEISGSIVYICSTSEQITAPVLAIRILAGVGLALIFVVASVWATVESGK